LSFTKRTNIVVFLLLLCILLPACGPSPEELAATSAAETAAAATSTPTITPTSTPTLTPTPTQTPTPTPIPDPDPKAMIDWKALNLPVGYRSLDPYEFGFGEGDWILGYILEDGTQVDYTIESSFVFGEAWPEVAYGWTLLFPTDFDVDVLDWYIDNFASQLAGIVETSQGQLLTIVDDSDYPEYTIVGDKSSEAWAVYIADGGFWSLFGAAFRIDNIGGFVFLRHPFESDHFMEIGDLARIYAESIETPAYHCGFTSITPALDYDLPAFEYLVEGFYPGEPIMISLSGDVRMDGKVERTSAVDPVGDSADQNGKLHGIMRFGDEVLELASPEFELAIIGRYSNCLARQVITWPGELGQNDTRTIKPSEVSSDDEESINIQNRSLRGSQIQERGIIQIGVRNDDMYPMNFKEESKHKGFEIDLAIEIVSRLYGDEFDIEWIPLSAQERIEAVQNDEVDLLIRNLTHTKSRAELVLFSSTYFLEGGSETEPLAIAVSQTYPIFRNNIDRILLEIIEDGTWQNIYDRWFDDPQTWTIEFMLSVPPANR